MDEVYIVKGKDPYNATKELLGKMKFSLRDKKVFIKVNVHPDKIPSTDVNVVKAILEKLKDCDIIIGGNVGILGKPFKINGYDKLARDFNVRLINLDKDESVIVKVKNSLRLKEFPISKTVLDADYIINAAKLKVHNFAKVTLCLKNLFGCIPGRTKLLIHPHINEVIHDYVQILSSDLNVIDGIVGNQFDECMPYPIDSNIIIGGYDPLSVDIVGTKCMGIEPEEVGYLKLLNYEKRKIKIIGEKIEDVKKDFNRKVLAKRHIRNFVENGLRAAIKLNLISR